MEAGKGKSSRSCAISVLIKSRRNLEAPLVDFVASILYRAAAVLLELVLAETVLWWLWPNWVS